MPLPDPSLLTGPGLDRLEERRSDPDVLGPDARVVVVHGHRALMVGGAPYMERAGERARVRGDAPAGAEVAPLVLLGDRDGVRYAARSVMGAGAEALEVETGGRFESLRTAVAALPPWQGGLLAYAAAIQAWHGVARFCGVCGAPTRSSRAGHERRCSGECGAVWFPRTDPAVITLVAREDEALLVRQPGWPAGRCSTLAGFVEPGESLEQAVAREVEEEVGLEAVEVEYFASQPWPFPHTLMVGYRTRAAGRQVRLGDELETARWYTRRQLRAALAGAEVSIPPPLSLSRSLIDDWLEGG
jgi:NAD+ diphosphatase